MAQLEAARVAFTEAVVLMSMVSSTLAVLAAIVVATFLRDVGFRVAPAEEAAS